MFLLLYRVDKKMLSSQVSSNNSLQEIADIQTLVDKKKNIVRKFSSYGRVIGLEVHAQINANTKMFSSAHYQF